MLIVGMKAWDAAGRERELLFFFVIVLLQCNLKALKFRNSEFIQFILLITTIITLH